MKSLPPRAVFREIRIFAAISAITSSIVWGFTARITALDPRTTSALWSVVLTLRARASLRRRPGATAETMMTAGVDRRGPRGAVGGGRRGGVLGRRGAGVHFEQTAEWWTGGIGRGRISERVGQTRGIDSVDEGECGRCKSGLVALQMANEVPSEVGEVG